MSGYIEATEFVKRLKREIDRGDAIVPLVGAGLSMASGIPSISEYEPYLFSCLKLMLDNEEDDDIPRWDPRRSKWPPIPKYNSGIIGSLEDEKSAWEKHQLGKFGSKDAMSAEDHAICEGIYSLRHWTSILSFLSCATIEDDKVTLEPLEDSVRDRFFQRIINGHQPNLGHFMLAHLSDPLRTQTVLTTNFDSLIEDAYAALGLPLAVFDVHQKAPLPHHSLVRSQPSLVKLHGAKFGLKADESLNEKPTAWDIKAFCGYFQACDNRDKKGRTSNTHLLVLGFSGSDKRIISLINAALQKGDIKSVWWVCSRSGKFKAIRDLFPKHLDKLFVTQHHDPGLFLHAAYQRICLLLPPAGADYNILSDVPAEPYPVEEGTEFGERFEKCTDHLKKAVDEALKSTDVDAPRILIVPGPRGLSSVAARVYEDLRDTYKRCSWLGLDDYNEPSDFFVSLVQSLSIRLGIRYTTPPAAVYDTSSQESKKSSADECRKELARCLSRSHEPIAVFLHARDGIGNNAGTTNEAWSEEKVDELLFLIEKIAQPGIVFVLLVQKNRLKHLQRALDGSILPLISPWPTEACIPFNEKDVIRKNGTSSSIEQWLASSIDDERDRKLRLLYALTLFRHSRHYAALCSKSLLQPLGIGDTDRDLERSCTGEKWISELEQMKAVRMKPGGRIWMHQVLKRSLRVWLESKNGPKLKDESGVKSIESFCHQNIADWYVKLFRSSNDPLAALESIYHRLQSLDRANQILDPQEQQHVREISVIQAICTLKIARNRILECGYFNSYVNLITTIEGDAEKLSRVENSPFSSKAAELDYACKELRRDFSAALADFEHADKLNNLATKTRPPTLAICVPPIPEHISLLRTAEYLTGLRHYKSANKRFEELFGNLGFSCSEQVCQDPSAVVTWKCAREWVTNKTEAIMEFTIEALGSHMFLHMLQAQAADLANVEDQKRNELQIAEAIYGITTEIMRHMENPAFLQAENARIRTHFSVVLSSMGRTTEAHRKLNEATSYLAKSEKSIDPIPRAVIELRRAEIYLDQADRLEEPNHKVAALNSSYLSLKRAREGLEGHREDMWWWTWLHELELTVCTRLAAITENLGSSACKRNMEGNEISIACAECTGRFERFTRIVDEGLRASDSDILRLSRIGRLCLEFIASTKDVTNHEHNFVSKCERIHNLLTAKMDMKSSELDKQIKRYARDTLALLVQARNIN